MAENTVAVKVKLIDEMSRELKAIRKNMDSGFKGMKTSANDANKSLDGARASLIGFKTIAIAVAGVIGTKLTGSVIRASAEMETLTIQFKTILGSASAAKKRMEELANFAATTPFQLPGIANANRTLQVFGGNILASQESMRMIGDAAAGVSQGFETVAFWVGRAYSAIKAGQPFGEAAMRLQEMAILTPEVRTKMEAMAAQGKSTEAVWGVFQGRLKEFNGAMIEQSKTWTGLKSTISDNVDQIFRDVGSGGIFDVMKDGLATVVTFFDNNRETIKEWAIKVGAFMGAVVKTFGETLKVVVSIFGDFNNSIGESRGLVINWTAVIAVAFNTMKAFALVVRAVWEGVQVLSSFLVSVFVTAINTVVTGVKQVIEAFSTLQSVWVAITEGRFRDIPDLVKEGYDKMNSLGTTFVEVEKRNWGDFANTLTESGADMLAAFNVTLTSMQTTGQDFMTVFQEMWNNAVKGMNENADDQNAVVVAAAETRSQMIKRIAQEMIDANEAAKNSIKGITAELKRQSDSITAVAVGIGEAFGSSIGRGVEGYRDFFKQSLMTLVDFLQREFMAAQVSAGLKAILGNPTALFQIVGATAAFTAAKAAIQNFETGGFPQGKNSLIRVNEQGQEAVLNARATRNIGSSTINALNQGGSPLSIDASVHISGNVTPETMPLLREQREEALFRLRSMLEELKFTGQGVTA